MNTINLFKHRWIENFFKNSVVVPKEANISEFKGKFAGVPAVIIASGPSLERNIHLVKELENKAVLISAGSSINAVEKNGITPHFMIGIDGLPIMSETYNGVISTDIVFVHTLTMHYDCVRKYQGPKMHVRSTSELNFKYMEDYCKKETSVVRTGGSCANIALDFAYNLGCDPIILIGQDLAYTNLVTHADGVIDRVDVKDFDSKKYVEAIDIYGEKTLTTRSLLTMKEWFDNYLENNKEVNVINGTEGGLHIEGTVDMKLEDAISKNCTNEYNIRGQINAIFEESLKGKTSYTYQDILEFLNHLDKEFTNLDKLSNKRIKNVKLIIEKIKKNKKDGVAKIREKVYADTDKINSTDIYRYFIEHIINDINYLQKNTSEIEAGKEADLDKKLLILYNALLKQHINIKEIIDITKEQVRNSIEEIKELIKTQ